MAINYLMGMRRIDAEILFYDGFSGGRCPSG